MSADRETDVDMTHRDIALLLADAADEVEIGIAPTQAVLRGGRRRRARRWAVATATALVIAGTSGAVAVAGLPGGGEPGQVATEPSPERRNLSFPERTTLATGTEDGKGWRVLVDVWPAPRDKAEAHAVWNAMADFGQHPPEAKVPSELIGRITYFVHRRYGDEQTTVMENTVPESETHSGRDLVGGAVTLEPREDGPARLAIGSVAKSAQRVGCAWKDGTRTVVQRDPAGTVTGTDHLAIRPAEGSPFDWFVCLAPKGTEFRNAEVTR